MAGRHFRLHVLQSSLRPEPVPRIQDAYLGSLQSQLLATVAIVALAAGMVLGISRLRPTVERRFGSQKGEIVSILALATVIGATVYALSVVWRVTFVLWITFRTMTFGRWVAAQQLVTFALIATAYLAIRAVNRSIDKAAETKAITKHQSEVAHHVADVAIVSFVSVVILTLWGIDLTNVFIGAGALTALVALTARETLAAMLAGFILLFSRPFRVGDWIEVNETDGIVTDVTIFTTKIQTFDDTHVLVPNDEVTDSQLVNYSRNDQLRIDLEVGVDYDADLEHARSVAVEAVGGVEQIKDTPAPQAVARRFGDSAILLEVHLWIGDPTKRREHDARTAALESIHAAFDREGIDIPFPQRIHAARNDSLRVATSGTENDRPASTLGE
ncbi:mechanosensitive ion channel protein MscS [Halobiforma lacisalsi AJ5]|uniref:Mechanosensitive ion channel MscS n=1 Tax=Natronobacterium lacisalsi AJ5 TaxID=358396 RepID=M0LG68_NATLA|nr:mechanosensitive ion channel family protein [Halobiforma lacisalsi]APW98735.1 mechanosensitive ion channel protein MscS [Halobiforma lacisalsi AJ5]EMA32607.1 mechanosensitive ion channel MscS [Halobiforma lacisalsi AJ5]